MKEPVKSHRQSKKGENKCVEFHRSQEERFEAGGSGAVSLKEKESRDCSLEMELRLGVSHHPAASQECISRKLESQDEEQEFRYRCRISSDILTTG